MALNPYLRILIDGQDLDIVDKTQLGLKVSYSLENTEDFNVKGASLSLGIHIPATGVNDRIFNAFHDTNAWDNSDTGEVFTNPRSCSIIVGSTEILTGKCLLQSAGHTRMPESYEINCYGQNGDWTIDGMELTLWDCLNPNNHTFNVATVEGTWTGFDTAGDGSDDFVYAPVRYRQPFTYTDANGTTHGNDDEVNIFHLRPAISLYWLIQRFFTQLGYTINSNFFETTYVSEEVTIPYFRRMVLPWVWGDFYDINGSILAGCFFTAAGKRPVAIPSNVPPDYPPLGIGAPALWFDSSVIWSTFYGGIGVSGLSGYVKNMAATYGGFDMSNAQPPDGMNDLGCYSFDAATGSMTWVFNVPPSLLPYVAANMTVNFTMSMIGKVHADAGHSTRVRIEVTQTPSGGGPTVLPLIDYVGLDASGGADNGTLSSPTVFPFQVANVNPGDTLQFRIKYDFDNASSQLTILGCGWLNQNPSIDAIPAQWVMIQSTFAMTGFEIAIGSPVNMQWFDKFRSYKMLDLLRGCIDTWNLSIQTDPINKIVTIEPTHDYILPDRTVQPGYFGPNRLDWTEKQDLSKVNTVNLYQDMERQLDFSFMGDGSDGGANIWAARYKGIYLNNKILNPVNITNQENGIVQAIPGAGRYLLPERFKKGERAFTNRFFGTVLQYQAKQWIPLNPLAVAQLIAIIPENVSGSSASTIEESFVPKLAFYKGAMPSEQYGAWKWVGDPNAGGTGVPTYSLPTSASFDLPFMFAANYGYAGNSDPVLYYSNEIVGVIGTPFPSPGLLESFFLQRLATYRKGVQYHPWANLSLGDMARWEHRELIIMRGGLWQLVGIDNFDPLSEGSCQLTMWKVTQPELIDYERLFPSITSIMENPVTLPQFDLKYAQKLLYPSDMPQV